MTKQLKNQPKITVGIMDRQTEVFGRLNGKFHVEGFGPISGWFSAKVAEETIVLTDETPCEIHRSPLIKFTPQKDLTLSTPTSKPLEEGGEKPGSEQSFTLFNVTIGDGFHWERKEDQTFRGNLILCQREGSTITAINEISVEDYLSSVISSEMGPAAPLEFLKAHAIASRSWLLAGLGRERKTKETSISEGAITEKEEEVIRGYDREEHDLFDVCADDHCQRYQGITKIVSRNAEEAVLETRGMVTTYMDKICDARYSKCCGGFTEEFYTAWDDKQVPYLTSISDAPIPHQPIRTEEEASTWILSEPNAYCNTGDEDVLKKILREADRETKNFFRWKVEYSRTELEQILREKSGFDLGTLKEIMPLRRGPSGRISRLKIVGSKKSLVIGKELEIRRLLSWSHLYSSAFVVKVKAEQFIFHGSGWGHGVGLCQVGAAVMATRGFSAEKILKHYFRGVEINKIYR